MLQISVFRTLALACLLCGACFTAHADFDAKYKTYSGDLDNNGYSDLFLSRSPDVVVILLDDIPIPIAKRRVEYVVLMQAANKTFTVNSSPSAANVATMKTWTPSSVQLTARDLNVDGQQDIFIENFAADPNFVAGTADHIVFAANTPTTATAVAVTPAMRDFFTQIHGWILNRDYFINSAIDNDWYHYWAFYDMLQRDDPSSQVAAVIGEGEGQLNVYNRIPSAAAAWGAIYFSFGIDSDTGREAPFSSEPFPWPPTYDKFQWSMNSGWLAALMGKQAQFYDIQLYGPRTNGRGKFYPCERKILQGYPLREERPWQGTVPFTGGACAFF